jgi:hypothetical protein
MFIIDIYGQGEDKGKCALTETPLFKSCEPSGKMQVMNKEATAVAYKIKIF